MVYPAALLIVLASAATAPAVTRGDSYYHFSLGEQARLSGDTESALAEYRKAQKLDPAAGEIHVEIAKLLREAGRIPEALVEAREAVRLDPGVVDAHLVLAQLYQMRSDSENGDAAFKQAATEYERVIELDPHDGGSMLTLAMIYGQQLQDHKAAIRVWQQYLELDPGSFDAELQIGSHYLALGDAEHAAAALQSALALQPNSARAYQSLGDTYAGAGQPDQAVLNYRKALEIDPQNLRLRLSLGEVLFQAKRHAEALTEAEAALSADPKNRYALELEGRALRELKQYDRAAQVADQALALDPGDLKASYLKVTIAEARRDFAAAATELESIMSRSRRSEDPGDTANNDRVFLVHLGYAYQQLSRYADAAAAFGRAKAVGGEPDAQLLGYEIEALVQDKSYDRALAAVREARGKFPQNADLATQEATVLREKGDLPGAFAIVEKLRKEQPKEIATLLEIADFYQRAKRYDDAVGVLKDALALDQRNIRTLFLLGATYEREKRHDDAEAAFRDALQVQPDQPAVLNYLGYMNADRGVRVEEALSLIERALALDPDNGAYLDSRGWALYRLSRFEQAEDSLRRALDKNTTNAVIMDHLADTLRRRGHLEEALEYWRKALHGEDEGEELDRQVVEHKIEDAVTSLNAHNKH